MAGHGPTPKLPGNRSNRAKPSRGEWVTLPAEPFRGKRPSLPRVHGGLSAESKSIWEGWWKSPMAHMWQPSSDYPRLQRLIRMVDMVNRALSSDGLFPGFASMQTEIRHLEDGLGLSEKGRRDLRWLLSADEPELAEVRHLEAVRDNRPRQRMKAVDPDALARS